MKNTGAAISRTCPNILLHLSVCFSWAYDSQDCEGSFLTSTLELFSVPYLYYVSLNAPFVGHSIQLLSSKISESEKLVMPFNRWSGFGIYVTLFYNET